MSDWQNGGRLAHSGKQLYYNPNKSMTTYSSGSDSATFQVKTKDAGIKYQGDPDSSLAQAAAHIAYLAVSNIRK
jgi:hypothetical protein